ncbi:hypothetical protein K435DRAFT_851838 [Dendrothele bispora CBS 962.96]|uniref:Uncharacterized protein n=1 Tax=Dendrothele bispora (strain CBS 962.96) TaxID=1314807 RepID=A0A4V4HHQ2_DENBC|nr:hypothetical protein K435DRAFT_851838 [Dendrothele bispora CBS 962.96]
MFSSFTSLLPSALHPSSNQSPEPHPEIDDDDDDDVQKNEEEQVEGKKKKDKKEKSANETFIFVRPPPAKTNHPLNLQVQLVPPNTRAPGVTGTATPRQSIDGDDDTSGAALTRSTSAQSEASTYSGYGSTSSSGYASTSSFSSVNSTSSTRRMIIPLYNLQAHNVMTNTIVDAGTDAKIAKFTKRGLEMIDLALLEPVEVWPTPNNSSTNNKQSIRVDDARKQSQSATPEQTPASSAVSLPSFNVHDSDLDHSQNRPTIPSHLPSTASSAATPTPTKKNIFGKLFSSKRKDGPAVTSNSNIGQVDLSVMPPSKAAIGTVPSPVPEDFGPSPPTVSGVPRGHTRNLSNTINYAFRRSPSPANRDGRPVTSTGVTTPKKSSFFGTGSGNANASENGNDTLNPGVTTSRLSTSSRHSHHSGVETTNMATNGSSSSNNNNSNQNQIQPLPATLGIQPTLSTPGGPAALLAHFGSVSGFTSAGYPPPKHLGFGKGPALYVWVVRKWIKGGPGGLFGLASGMREVLGGISVATGNDGEQTEGRRSIGGIGGGGGGGDGLMRQVEVRVEWKRGKKPKKKTKGGQRERGRRDEDGDGSATNSRNPSRSVSLAPGGAGDGGMNESKTSLGSQGQTTGNGANLGLEEPVDDRAKRLSVMSGASTSVSEDIHEGGGSLSGKGGKGKKDERKKRSRQSLRASTMDDDGDESDPEDSETPWTCTLKVRKLAGGPSGTTPSSSRFGKAKGGAQRGDQVDEEGGQDGAPLKIKVGTLSPTPHHPKVVAMLKVPYPLPDLEVEKMNIRKREMPSAAVPAGSVPGSATLSTFASSGGGGQGSISKAQAAVDRLQGLALTAEEIKDVICSTGMWLVVREGFGGVGKVSRKGDGWRIRA